MVEIFKDIVGYEGLYQVSNLGNVKSLKFGKEKLLKLQLSTTGYFYINLSIADFCGLSSFLHCNFSN